MFIAINNTYEKYETHEQNMKNMANIYIMVYCIILVHN